MPHRISIIQTASDFEREKLIRPFGLKGGTLSELWQTIVSLKSASGHQRLGLSTQSVLYGDAAVFSAYAESEANALMYTLTARCLALVRVIPFASPFELMDKLLPEATKVAQSLTGRSDIHPNFVLNALVAVDHAAWLLYAAETGREDFEKMIPEDYRQSLPCRHERMAIIFQVPYGMPVEEIQRAAQQGYFLIKIKLGQAGSEEEMLQKDKDRMLEIHTALQEIRTDKTLNGKLIYTLDANGRYAHKESVQKLIDHAEGIGMREQVLLFEEPLEEKNEAFVGDMGTRMAADESLHDEQDALRRLEQGYEAFVLKSIAKTLTLTLKIARVAADHGVPCLCADLTVNPILMSWHQNLAARLPPFPGLENMGIMETNGKDNYLHWDRMLSYHPYSQAAWLVPQRGSFTLDKEFFELSGGIFSNSSHYRKYS